MSSYVLIAPSSDRDAINLLLEENGFGSNNFSVPLKTSNSVTHYGLHAFNGLAMAEFIQGEFDSVIVSVRDNAANHFTQVIEDNNLTVPIEESVV